MLRPLSTTVAHCRPLYLRLCHQGRLTRPLFCALSSPPASGPARLRVNYIACGPRAWTGFWSWSSSRATLCTQPLVVALVSIAMASGCGKCVHIYVLCPPPSHQHLIPLFRQPSSCQPSTSWQCHQVPAAAPCPLRLVRRMSAEIRTRDVRNLGPILAAWCGDSGPTDPGVRP
jgi:hypothetical protein